MYGETAIRLNPEIRRVEYPFDKYILEICVDENNRFIGVDKVVVKQIFYDSSNIKSRSGHDFDKFVEMYVEEDQ